MENGKINEQIDLSDLRKSAQIPGAIPTLIVQSFVQIDFGYWMKNFGDASETKWQLKYRMMISMILIMHAN